MQTFITSTAPDFGVANLDSKRLNKQLLEGRQILNILITLRNDPNAKIAWRNHPAVKMWAGCEYSLYTYLLWTEVALKERGIKTDKNMNAIINLMDGFKFNTADIYRQPSWLTDPVQADKIITTHRASLYRKDPEYYADWKYDAEWVDSHRDLMVCCDRCNYHWPTHKEA